MKTITIGLRELRRNIGKLAKEGKDNNVVYLVTSHNKPLAELRPYFGESAEFDSYDLDHLQYLENHLDFWDSSDDDDIFAV
jgi:hypothetical protein